MKKYILTITAGAPAYYLNAISTIAGALIANGGYNSERNKNGTFTITYDSEEDLKESIKAAAAEINDEHGEGSANFSETSISYDSAYSEIEVIEINENNWYVANDNGDVVGHDMIKTKAEALAAEMSEKEPDAGWEALSNED